MCQNKTFDRNWLQNSDKNNANLLVEMGHRVICGKEITSSTRRIQYGIYLYLSFSFLLRPGGSTTATPVLAAGNFCWQDVFLLDEGKI